VIIDRLIDGPRKRRAAPRWVHRICCLGRGAVLQSARLSYYRLRNNQTCLCQSAPCPKGSMGPRHSTSASALLMRLRTPANMVQSRWVA